MTPLSKEQVNQNKLLKINFTDKYDKELAQMREQNYQLNKAFTENLMQMKEQARKLQSQRSRAIYELSLARQYGEKWTRSAFHGHLESRGYGVHAQHSHSAAH